MHTQPAPHRLSASLSAVASLALVLSLGGCSADLATPLDDAPHAAKARAERTDRDATRHAERDNAERSNRDDADGVDSDATEQPGREPGTRAASPRGRGIWMNYHSGSAYGLGEIVGNAALESVAITRLQNWAVTRVYGGYRTLPVSDRADVAGWNATLYAAGIQSQILLGAPHHIFTGAACRQELLDQIDARLIAFNEGPTGTSPLGVAERFHALHLDVEPQAFKAGYYVSSGGPPGCAPTSDYWNVTPSRAELLALLYQTFVDVRVHLDTSGYEGFPIYVDLPPWFDSSTSIDWDDTPDFTFGIDWIHEVGQVVDGITFMTYARDDAADIRTSVLDERMVLLHSVEARTSVNAKERSSSSWTPSTITWTSLSQLWSVVTDLESGTGLFAYDVDLFNYRYMASPWPLTWEEVVRHRIIRWWLRWLGRR